mgnify:CR=1 FL=1
MKRSRSEIENEFINQLPKLNLPEFSYRYQIREEQIYILDEIRKKFILLTPEEWVRQNFVKYLMNEKKFSPQFIRVEHRIKLDNLTKRCDIIIFDNKLQPYLIVECKSPDVVINQSTLQQIGIYNIKLKAKYLAVTNGLNHYYFNNDFENKRIFQIDDIPKNERN